MKNIINAIITFVVFWIGNEYFTEYIQIQDTKTLIIATILMFVISYVFDWLISVSILLIPLGIGCLTTLVLVLLAFILTPVKLVLLNNCLDGFTINGFWTYVALTAIFSIFSVKSKSNSSDSDS